MIDHLLKFQDEKSAHQSLDPLGFGSAEGWDTSRVIAPAQVSKSGLVLPGYWVYIGLEKESDALKKLSGKACNLVTDREAALRKEAFVKASEDPDASATYEISPRFMGSDYIFGGSS